MQVSSVSDSIFALSNGSVDGVICDDNKFKTPVNDYLRDNNIDVKVQEVYSKYF